MDEIMIVVTLSFHAFFGQNGTLFFAPDDWTGAVYVVQHQLSVNKRCCESH